jgi:hypothetical protein
MRKFLCLPLTLLLFSCSSSSNEPVCEAGRQIECTCPGGSKSSQTCLDDGSRWNDCVCPCVKDCTRRECGPDPVCGESCGTCVGNSTCNESGVCEFNKRQEAALRRAYATFTRVKELAKQEKWIEARPLMQEVAAVLTDDPLVKEYQETIDREDRASRALLEAKAKIALEDFDDAILILHSIPGSSMYSDSAKELKKKLTRKLADSKPEKPVKP